MGTWPGPEMVCRAMSGAGPSAYDTSRRSTTRVAPGVRARPLPVGDGAAYRRIGTLARRHLQRPRSADPGAAVACGDREQHGGDAYRGKQGCLDFGLHLIDLSGLFRIELRPGSHYIDAEYVRFVPATVQARGDGLGGGLSPTMKTRLHRKAGFSGRPTILRASTSILRCGFQTRPYARSAKGLFSEKHGFRTRPYARPHSRRMKRSMPRPGDAGHTKERGRGQGRARVRNTSVWLG